MTAIHPLLFEINARCWLRELSGLAGRPITLATVPDSEFTRWRELGFTHIWLMGVWTTGPLSRAHALSNAHLREIFDRVLPGWTDADVPGSPYAIADYHVPAALGGDDALARFRERLHAAGLKLILDFVPNHLGLDHPWAAQRPDLFVNCAPDSPGALCIETASGPRWLAHGKDPHFHPWTDTLQLDYRNPETRAAMTGLLQSVAARCNGVRCDMAMLLLNDIFARTWARCPSAAAPPSSEFWSGAITAVRAAHPDFLFLAEVYWGLEPRLQSLGFDFTYDKHVYDCLVNRNHRELQRHLLEAAPGYNDHSARFLENHDERRIASLFSPAEHRAAALVVLGLPGMRFLHEGQLTGARIHIPVQLARRPVEPPDPEITALYHQLLATLKDSAVGHGPAAILRPDPAWPGNPSAQNFIIIHWPRSATSFDLAVINLATHPSQCRVKFPFALSSPASPSKPESESEPVTIIPQDPPAVPSPSGLGKPSGQSAGKRSSNIWHFRDLLSPQTFQHPATDLHRDGLFLDLPAHRAQLFRCELLP